MKRFHLFYGPSGAWSSGINGYHDSYETLEGAKSAFHAAHGRLDEAHKMAAVWADVITLADDGTLVLAEFLNEIDSPSGRKAYLWDVQEKKEEKIP